MKFFYSLLFCFSISIVSSSILNGQTLISTCPNSNFNLGNFANWTGTYGLFQNPGQYPGLDTNVSAPYPHGNFQCYNGNNKAACPPLHSIIPGPGTLDPNTGNSLISVFPGESYGARLGHNVGGSHAATLKYTVYVDNSTYLFIYRYAVVLENPNHSPITEQPSFTVAVEDSTGAIFDSACGYYYIASPPYPGILPPTWHRYSGNTINWKEWTTVGMSLANHVGHHVSIVFTTRDCSPGGHFGYAYVSAYCSYLTVQTSMCQGDSSATLTAPPGFAHYYWSTGDTVRQIVVPHPTTGETDTCLLTAVNGCQSTILVTLTYTVITTNFTYGPACSGLPTQFNDSSYVNQNSVTGWKWDFGDATPIVNGNPNPQHIFALPGTYNVKLVSNSTEGCKDSITKAVVVDTLPLLTNNPLFEKICSRGNTNLTLTSNKPGNNFTWTATANSGLVTGYSSNTTIPTTVINQTLSNTDNKIDTVTYLITPHSATSLCVGIVTNYKVAVKPLPILTNATLTEAICDSVSTNIQLLSNNDSTLFTWTCTASSPDLSGYSDNTSIPGTQINQIIYNSGAFIDTVIYHIVPHSFGCSGDTSKYKVIVYPFADLSNVPPNESICNNEPTGVTLTSHIAGTLFTWTCTPSSINLSGFSNNAIPTTLLNQTLFNSGITTETVTYNIVPKANGCTGHTSPFVVTVFPVPDLSNSPASKQICSDSLTNITLTSNVTGTLFTWTATPSSGNVSGFTNNNIPSVTLNDLLINTGFSNEMVTYSITPHANGCDGNPANYFVTVYPSPNLSNSPPSEQICSNTATNVTLTSNVNNTLFTWTCTPSSGSVSGFSNNPTPTTILNQTLTNSSLTDQTVTYNITPQANGCNGSIFYYTVTVHPLPVPTLTGATSVCNGLSATYTTDAGNSNYTWTVSSGGTTTGGGGTGDNTITVLWHLTGPQSVQVNYVLPTGCTAASPTILNITVNPLPAPTISGTNFICSGFSAVYSTQGSMTAYSWTVSAGGAITAGGTATDNTVTVLWNTQGLQNVSVNYHDGNGCTALSASNYAVTVYPLPVPTISGSISVCLNSTTVYTTEAGMSTYIWTLISGGTIVSGGTTNTVNINWTTNGAHTITVNYTNLNGCTAVTATSYIVTVTNLPIPTLIGVNTICTGFSTIYSTDLGESNYSWTVTAGGTITSGGTATDNTATILWTVPGAQIVTVNYSVGPGCSAPTPTPRNVTVNPLPTATIGVTTAVCQNAASPLITFTGASSTPPYTFTYNINGGGNQNVTTVIGNSITVPAPTNVVGSFSYNLISVQDASSTLCSQLQAGTATVTINALPVPGISGPASVCLNSSASYFTETSMSNYTWSVSAGGSITSGGGTSTIIVLWSTTGPKTITVNYINGNGCTAPAPTSFPVTVNTLPVPSLNGTTVICTNTSVTYTTDIGMNNYSWLVSAGGSITAGGGASDSFVTVLWNTAGLQTVSVNYFMSTGCTAAAPFVLNVTVKPRPAITNAANSTMCSSGTTNIVFTSSLFGTTYTWTAIGSSGNVSGYSNGSGGSIIQTLVNTGFSIETVNYAVTPSLNGCDGPIAHYIVTVNPVADVYFNPNGQSFCSGGTTSINILSHVAGATFTWTATGSSGNVSGFGPGNGNLIAQTLNNSGPYFENVNYDVFPLANSCAGTDNHVIVNMNPTPQVSFTTCNDIITTTDAKPITLKGGIPLGGVYSGPGVNTGIFYPSLAGPGNFSINYSYSNTWGCNANMSKTISVISAIPFFCDNLLNDIRDNQQYPTVKLGTQCWMSKNLNYGNIIPATSMQRDNCISEKYCFNDDVANCATYGGLYQWDELMQYDNTAADQGFCPPAWHIPTNNDWNTLFGFYISNGFAGSPLKYSGYSGFNAFLSGTRFNNVNWNFTNFAVMFWTSTTDGTRKAWAHGMNIYNPSVSNYPSSRTHAFNVRCIKD